MFRTLYARLVAVLVAVFVILALTFTALVLIATRDYEAEVMQRLNLDLAEHIAKEQVLIENGRVDREALEHVFHMLMVINPAIELYLLDPQGKILAFSAPPGQVVRERVSLEPIRTFLAGNAVLPLRGDDPRHPDRGKVFSVVPVKTKEDDRLEGYLYVILASQQYDSVVERLRGSHVLRLTLGVAGVALVFAFIAAAVTFTLLTRRLRALLVSVDEFRRGDFAAPMPPIVDEVDDEIGDLIRTIHLMSTRLIELMNELKRTDSLRRELVANVSHDLRTPLASLQGYLETLLLKRDSMSQEEQRHCLEIANRQAERLGRLISELFELSKLEANEARPHFESCAMPELVQDVLQKFELRAREAGVELRAIFPEDLPPVWIDIALMERVLQNLIENALHYTPAGGRVEVRIAREGHAVRVEVSDNGAGITAEDLPSIFDRFYRAGRRDVGTNNGGAGLGLAIARKIVELHGSKLDVASRVDEGTTFTFYPPLLQS